MKTSEDYKISSVRTIVLNGKKCKEFSAYTPHKNGIGETVLHFVGSFTAPAKTANKDLWLVVDSQGLET